MKQLNALSLNESNLKTEVIAGITTFLSMIYIAFLNPSILSQAGMDSGAVFTATCLVTAFGCALTGLIANSPIAVGPAMALNVYFTYSVVQGMAIPWQQALAMVCISGLLFFLLTLTQLRRLFIEAIPHNLQIATLIGISLLIALIALKNNLLIVSNPQGHMHLGELFRPESALFFLGFIMMLVLDYFRIPGAIVMSIMGVSLLSFLLGLTSWQGFMSTPPSLMPTLLQCDFSQMTQVASLQATFTFFLITLFDATGTLIGLLNPTVFKSRLDYPQRLARCLTADAAASALAGFLGSASTSPYIESATGIEAGGRTGLTSIVVAIGFILMLFFFPLAKMIPSYAVGPALLYVACCMMKHIMDLKLIDITETAPCMITILMIPFTSSIADGIGLGIILYTLLKACTKQKINPLMGLLSLIFVVFFIIG